MAILLLNISRNLGPGENRVHEGKPKRVTLSHPTVALLYPRPPELEELRQLMGFVEL